MKGGRTFVVLVFVVALGVSWAMRSVRTVEADDPSAAQRDGLLPVATFSVVGFDPATGDLGVAVQSKFFGVGTVVPWAQAGVGAIATQSYANTTYGPNGLQLLSSGLTSREVITALTSSDSKRGLRQLGIVDAKGRASSFTGEECNEWAGHRIGSHHAVQGNLLTGEEVVEAMDEAYRSAVEAGDGLADRLMASLKAGQGAGGDRRGRQSAALLVVRKAAGYGGMNDRFVDLRVEDHPRPIEELARLLNLHREFYRRAHGNPPVRSGGGDE